MPKSTQSFVFTLAASFIIAATARGQQFTISTVAGQPPQPMST